jgi:hypothetical protein
MHEPYGYENRQSLLLWARGTEKGAVLLALARACGPGRRRKLGEVGERLCASKIALRVRAQVRSEQTALRPELSFLRSKLRLASGTGMPLVGARS